MMRVKSGVTSKLIWLLTLYCCTRAERRSEMNRERLANRDTHLHIRTRGTSVCAAVSKRCHGVCLVNNFATTCLNTHLSKKN
jgi:hypothetical protein